MISIPHLETRLTLACQNRCIACNAFVPLYAHDFKATFADPAVFDRDLRNFARVAKTAIWAAMGGEPLLHPDLCDFLEIAKRSDAVGQVEVRTNGQAIRDMPERFWKLVDILIVTAYPGKNVEVDWIREQCEEYFIRYELRDERTTQDFMRLLEPATDPVATAEKYRTCWFRTFCRVLDRGYFFRCCTTSHIPPLVLGLPYGTDGIRVDADLTEEKLAEYLAEATSPASCRVCCGMGTPSTKLIPWREVDEPQAWLRASGLTG